MKILLIAYCHFADGFFYSMKELEKYGYSIDFFPYFNYVLDDISERDDILVERIQNYQPEICFWWNNRITSQNIQYIQSHISSNIKHLFYNWDPYLYSYEKYDCFSWKEVIEERIKIHQLMDHYFSCFQYEIDFLKTFKSSISYLPPGFDKHISYPSSHSLSEYRCDISIVFTNLYQNEQEYPKKSCHLHRYEVINGLYQHRNQYIFHIYGPSYLKEIYPDCYRYEISYQDCYKVFSNSKINLSIHALADTLHDIDSEQEYFSERVPQILGCKGLLVTNSHFSDIHLRNHIDYIYLQKENWFDTIQSILQEDHSKIQQIRENGYQKGLQYYQWSEWAKKVHQMISIELCST